ncbi:MAG: hypothetical protein JJE10_03235 [Thermoleophilia bacterium]|nr:hypothetical protein [Thermoleophilia bacterium]
MEIFWLLLLGLAVAAFVSRPFWAGADPSRAEDPEVAALEAARDAKYREIRDARADRDSGKLPEEDFEILNAELRREAIAILDRLDRARSGEERSRGDQERTGDGSERATDREGRPEETESKLPDGPPSG